MNPRTPRPIRSHYAWNDAVFQLLDGVLSCWPFWPKSAASLATPPSKVLLANFGHWGDMVLSTAAIIALREQWPNLQFGFLGRPLAKEVLEGLAGVVAFHTLEPEGRGPLRNAFRNLEHRRQVLAEIRACGYEHAVDLHPWRPSAVRLLYCAGIPNRIAYGRLGFRPLLTTAMEYTYDGAHEARTMLRLLQPLGLAAAETRMLRTELPGVRGEEARFLEDWLKAQGVTGRYCVLHPGGSKAQKSWPAANWENLIEALSSEGWTLVLTGIGLPDRVRNAALAYGRRGVKDATGELPWRVFVEIIRRAAFLVSVDTVAGHVAAATGTPCVSLFSGMVDIEQWRPLPSPRHLALTSAQTCAPCYRKNGCSTMACIAEVTPGEVLAGIAKVTR